MRRLNKIWPKEANMHRTCMLMITHSCNLNCTYCYEQYKSKNKMSFEIAKSLILKDAQIVKKQKKFKGLEIDLMGGEPMTNFQLVKELVEWAETGVINVPWIFFMTTNGTLFTDEHKQWFKRHRSSIECAVSYDGTPKMQQDNRGSNSTQIDLNFFLKTWKKQGVHLTISKSTLPYLADGILTLQRKNIPVEIALAEGIKWNELDAELYAKQLHILCDAYIKDDKLIPVNILTRQLDIVIPEKDKRKMKKFCGAGTHMITYDTNGKSYACHMFSPIVLGPKANKTNLLDFKSSAFAEDPDCQKCCLKHFCPTCAGFNYRYRNNPAIRDKYKCKLHLYEAIISADFQLKLIANNCRKLTDEDALYAESALKAKKILQNINIEKYPFTIKENTTCK